MCGLSHVFWASAIQHEDCTLERPPRLGAVCLPSSIGHVHETHVIVCAIVTQ